MGYKEKFIEKLKNKYGKEYKLIGDYKNATTKTKFKHNKCGTIITNTPRGLLENKGVCFICDSALRLNEKQFLKKLEYFYGNEYTPTKHFKKLTEPLEFVHRDCGVNFTIIPNRLFKKRTNKKGFCPICHGLPKTTEIFKYEIKTMYGNAYKFIGEYKGYDKSAEFIHKKCGFKFEKRPVEFLNGKQKCPVCDGVKKKKSDKIFILQVEQQVGKEYEFTEPYVDAYTRLNCIHKKCGKNFKISPSKFLNKKQRCPKCTSKRIKNKFKKGLQQFKKEVYEKVENEYKVISKKYINTDTPITFKHNSTNCDFHEFKTTPDRFLNQEVRCPVCTRGPVSKAMILIEKLLNKESINFKKEYKFEDLKYKRYLRFDYAVFNKQGNLLFLLEYDGEQHYKPIKYFGDIDGFIDQQLKDSLKKSYCKENNIDLIRISFAKKKKLKSILYQSLKKYKLINTKENESA